MTEANRSHLIVVILAGSSAQQAPLFGRLREMVHTMDGHNIELCMVSVGSSPMDASLSKVKICKAVRRVRKRRLDYLRIPYEFGELTNAMEIAVSASRGAVIFPLEWIMGLLQTAALNLLACFPRTVCGAAGTCRSIAHNSPQCEWIRDASVAMLHATATAEILFPIRPGWLGLKDSAQSFAQFLHHLTHGVCGQSSEANQMTDHFRQIWQATVEAATDWFEWIHQLAYPDSGHFDWEQSITAFERLEIGRKTFLIMDAASDALFAHDLSFNPEKLSCHGTDRTKRLPS